LFGLLDIALSFLSRTVNCNEAECDTFEEVVRCLGAAWRQQGLYVTPKFHFLETHALQQLRRIGNLGSFAEQAIEKEHSRSNNIARQFHCFRNWKHRHTLTEERQRAQATPEVQQILSDTRAKQRRTFSATTAAARAAQEEEKVEALQQRRGHYSNLAREYALQQPL